MQSAQLDESQARIKISGRNINNLIYADCTTLMEESVEKLDEETVELLMEVKERVKKLT